MRKLLLATLACVILLAAALFAGPVTSGALLLLLPSRYTPVDHDLPEDYVPLHKGGIDLATGLYVRENEDLVVRGTPALILRRTYISRYNVSKEFGIGTTHNGEWYLRGDNRFQWAELIRTDGSRITFARTSWGTSFLNAMYRHRSTPSEWQGARLGWTGGQWALRRRDGSLDLFQPCGPGIARACSVIRSRDTDGHWIDYRRDGSGRLMKMEAGNRWIAFEYDAHDRISRAHDSNRREVRYAYDARGRLSLVTAPDGTIRSYTYTDRNELETIAEPGISVENVYDEKGHCIRQVNRFEDDAAPFVFDFTYHWKDGVVVQTDTRESDGSWSRYTWGEGRYATSETRGREGAQPAIFTYERDSVTKQVTALALTCPDRTGRPLRHSSVVRPDNEAWIKWDLLRTHCSWTGRNWRSQ